MNVELLQWLNGFAGKHPFLDVIVIFFAEYAIYILFIGAALWTIAGVRAKQYEPIVAFFAALAVSFIVLQLLGLLSDLPRPFADHSLTVLLPGAGGEAFPSDHTAASAAIAFAFLFFLRNKKVGSLLVGLACMIGLARIISGVHYPLDVAGGLLAGFSGAFIVWLFARKWFAEQLAEAMNRFTKNK